MSTANPFLVIVRAGDDSLHERWLDRAERDWDLVVSYEGAYPERFRRADSRRVDRGGTKWEALGELLGSGEVDWQRYEYVWLAQGDLLTNADDISRLFGICKGLDLWLAHPALSHDSHAEHRVTLHNSLFGLRFTNFVEKTAPVFKTDFLRSALASMQVNASGGGIDHVWPRLLENPALQCAVVDSVVVKRVRPMAGVVRYTQAPADEELRDAASLLEALSIKDLSELSLGALMRTGERYSLYDETADAFLGRLLRGMIGTAGGAAALGQTFLVHERARRMAGEPPVQGSDAKAARPRAAAAPGTSERGASLGGTPAAADALSTDEEARNRAAVIDLAVAVRAAAMNAVR